MPNARTWIVAATVAAAAVAAGGGTALASSAAEGPDVPITLEALSKASAAALAHTGGGAVIETEAGDEQGADEIEVTRPDGSRVDVHLDAGFQLLSTEADGPAEDGRAPR